MLEPRFRWTLPGSVEVPEAVRAAGVAHGLGPRAIELIFGRGVGDGDALERFLAPAAAGLHDPRLLPDADLFHARVRRAREAGERVLVFGDFDADGLTGLAILTRTLRRMGVDATPYVPDRVEEGHGLSIRGIEAAVAAGATLIVTVDCGSSSASEVGDATARGIDVIVTDHHRVPEALPAAAAFVNAHRSDATYPDRRLTGAGLAFRLADLLLADGEPMDDRFRAQLAALAAVGTVGDVAPVLGENRSIARLGIEGIRIGASVGIAALLRRAGLDPAKADLETIGFAIAPRLNAASRMGDAGDAAALLLTDDAAEADRLAERLEGTNEDRRDLTKTAVAEARAVLPAETGEPAIVIHGPWPAGIVGLVAARLADDRGLPAVVGSEMGETIRASCRGDGRLDLAATLRACDDLLNRHGGHRGAAGLEIAADRWDAFRERFMTLAADAAPADPRVGMQVDLTLAAEAVDYDLLRDLARLAPYGPGHQEPLLAITGLTATRVRAATGGHSQLTLRRTRDVLDGIAFGRSDLAETVGVGQRIDVVARLMTRTFGGFESLQLEIRDAAAEGHIAGLVAAERVAAERVAAGSPSALVAVGPGPGVATIVG